MGTDQGKTSNINALVLMGDSPGAIRPRSAPRNSDRRSHRCTLGLLAAGASARSIGRSSACPRLQWHEERGALFEQFGNWVRPAAYPRPGESLEAAAQREAGAVRKRAGCSTARRSASSKSSDPMPRNSSISCTWARCRP
jgi:sarcosine oxidase, subunit alpha